MTTGVHLSLKGSQNLRGNYHSEKSSLKKEEQRVFSFLHLNTLPCILLDADTSCAPHRAPTVVKVYFVRIKAA